ncbi:MAG: transporter substrate-binding domain-containing protein [Myxococcales bacterium]|nr:transporter substrate-binding domain-containing protein [Myxococcales bacterium]
MLPLAAALLLLPLAQPAPGGAADEFANLEVALTRHTRDRYVADLEEIKRRGVLRVLTRNSSSTYFISKGEQRGFQFELVQAFAKELGVRLAIVVPPSRDELIQSLLAGEGDLIAAGMSIAPDRAEKVRFTSTVFTAGRVFVTHRHTIKLVESVADLAQFDIHVSYRSTTYAGVKAAEREAGVPFRILDTGGDVEMEEILDRISAGVYESTVVDESLVALAQAAGADVEARLPLGAPKEKGWAVHPAAPNLADAADEFVRRHRRSGLIRMMYARYMKPDSKFAARARDLEYRADANGKISPYDDLFKEASKETGIDWRLLAAVAYSESRFNPKAASRWGAVGLMQLLPSTAKRVGISKRLQDPRRNILAGARYLRRLCQVFEEDGVAKRQQMRFALAAYNAGLGHIMDARHLAELTGKDRNRWFHNVAEALKLKQDRKWHEKTRYGYARAEETVTYVSKIQSRYDVYVRHVPLDAGDEPELGAQGE